MAYSTMVLAWGMLKFKDGYNSPGKLDMACDMIKWPLEYFLKCWVPNENTLYVQVILLVHWQNYVLPTESVYNTTGLTILI